MLKIVRKKSFCYLYGVVDSVADVNKRHIPRVLVIPPPKGLKSVYLFNIELSLSHTQLFTFIYHADKLEVGHRSVNDFIHPLTPIIFSEVFKPPKNIFNKIPIYYSSDQKINHMNISRRSLAPARNGLSVRTFSILRCKGKDTNHSIFQVNNGSRFVSLNDVKEALEVTRNFSAYQRLKYFKEKGIHYTRALRYVRLVEQFEEALTACKEQTVDHVDITHIYNQSYMEEDERDNDNYVKPPTSLSSEDIGRFIDEVMQERDEHENTHLVGEAKPYLKQYDHAIIMSKTVEQLEKHGKNIGLLIIVMMFIHFLCVEWGVYVGDRT